MRKRWLAVIAVLVVVVVVSSYIIYAQEAESRQVADYNNRQGPG